MARMIPKQPHPDTKSQAELRLFEAFERQLSPDYTVFHSVSWQLRDIRNGAQDGETDFLVVHPDYGILIVEVKGGHIRYDGVQDQWYTYNEPIKDPFKQGRKNKYSLLEKLKELPYWRNRWITVGYAAAFPDVSVKGDLRLDAPRQLILDAADMTNLWVWVDQAMHYLTGQHPDDSPLGRTGVEELVKTLSPSVDLPPLLSIEIETQAQEQERLTREQFMMLDFLGRRRRVAISGCAGSGKTTLAYEKARRLAEQDFKVLLTCFNANVADWLQLESDETRPANLRIANFHRLAEELVRKAGLSTGPHDDDYFEKILPEQMMQAVDQLGSQFDAIIVDEGQDFSNNWWLPLQWLLHDPDQGILYVFFDDNQNIYGGEKHLPLESAPFPLPHNCRNTRYIHEQVLAFYSSESTPSAIGPQGRPIQRYSYADSADLKRRLRRILHQLIVEQEVPAWDIVLLTPKGRERSELWRFGALGNFRLTDQPSEASGEVYCSTIHSFKGMESPIVILAELDNDQLWQLSTLLYIGCSRARNHLVLLTAADLSDKIKTKLTE
jgi:hypothetical protein